MSKEPYDPMDMKALRCFETMARHGSLTQASIELGVQLFKEKLNLTSMILSV